jgi:atypical protein kinase C zeta type
MAHLLLQKKHDVLGWGDLGLIFKISDYIALKCAIEPDDERFENENRVFDKLDCHLYCPHLVYSFVRLRNINFMQLIPGGNLEMRLRARQRRHSATGQVLEVDAIEARPLIQRWMKELTSAGAWLESHGLAHGDIRPSNLLLDAGDHLKLADFDNTKAIGAEVEVGTAPYARALGDEAGPLRGTFGFLGHRTEQFAVGSVLYYMTRGYEPYDDQWYGNDHGPVTVDLLQRMEFPHMDVGEETDNVIRKCWYGEFPSMEELANTATLLACQKDDGALGLTPDFIEARREECRQYVEDCLTTIQFDTDSVS